jgi:hypothetical protein
MVGGKLLSVVVKVVGTTPSYSPPRGPAMAAKRVTVWYDAEGDYLEVILDQRSGPFRKTESIQEMEKVDVEANVLGFSVFGVSTLKWKPLEVAP